MIWRARDRCGRQAGFSLMELLMVLAVMGILGGLGLSAAGGLRRWLAQQETRALFNELQSACLQYRLVNGCWPDALESGIVALNSAGRGWLDELGPYLERRFEGSALTDGNGNTDLRLVVDADGDHWIRRGELGNLVEADLWARVAVFSVDSGGRLAMASWE